MRRMWWWVALLATACGTSTPGAADLGPRDLSSGDEARADLPGPSDPGSPGETGPEVLPDGPCIPAPFPGPLAGTWAQIQVREAIVTSPSLSDVRRIYTTLALWTVTGEGNAAQVRSHLCAVQAEAPDSPVQTVIPLDLIRSLPNQDLPCTFRSEDSGVRLDQARHLEVRGARLAHPETDPLPTDPQDPAVVDQDQDGQPGVTVLLTGLVDGAVYVVQRLWTRLEGCSDLSGGFRGSVSWGEEQVVLGSDNPVLVMQSVITPVPDAGRFRMRRVPEGSDCGFLMAHQEEIFSD